MTHLSALLKFVYTKPPPSITNTALVTKAKQRDKAKSTIDKSSGSIHSSGLIPFQFELAAINRRAAG